jgi:threonine synthase
VAGLRKVVADGRIDPGGTVVAVLTGLGLKDPDTAATLGTPPLDAEPTVDAVRAALGW